MKDEKASNMKDIIPNDTKSKKNTVSYSEVNTYDLPPFTYEGNSKFALKGDGKRKEEKSFWRSFYTFLTFFTVFLAIIFASSELSDFIMKDMGAGNMIINRIFGSGTSMGEVENLSNLILKQTFIDLSPKVESESIIKPPASPNDDNSVNDDTEIETKPDTPPESEEKESQAESDTAPESESSPKEEEITPKPNQHPIISMDLSAISLGDRYIHNTSSHSPDTKKLLDIKLKSYYKENVPLVLVVHTHTTESYTPQDVKFYTDGDEIARSTNSKENMIAVGKTFIEALEANGIMTIHCTVMHDATSYRESYARAAESIKKYLKAYPSIKYVFDLHRDSIMRSDSSLVSATTTIDGEKYAQVMPVVGSSYDGFENNLAFALQLRQRLNQKYVNICRPPCLRSSSYNQNLPASSLLLEIGSSGNTLQEAKRSAILLANELAYIIKN